MEASIIDIKMFESIERRHGGYASWAVWADAADKPKSNIGDLSIFDLEVNRSLLTSLQASVVMVGLNISRSFSEPFRNFHDSSPKATDFKIRHAFKNTKYYGAYMTDIIKGIEMVASNDLLAHLKESPGLLEKNIETFREELRDLASNKPLILAFGSAAHKIMVDNVDDAEYSTLIRLTHYSHQIGKEKYRDTVLNQINTQMSFPESSG